jgi:hypothetical protein
MAGARVWNGINIIPPLADWRVIDPEGRGMEVYNRYGYIQLSADQDATVGLSVVRNDLYEMRVDPKSDLWRALGIRYVVLPPWIYRLHDGGTPSQ